MPRNAEKNTKAKSRTTKKSAKADALLKKDDASECTDDRFVKDVLVRGEAVKPTAEGKLPLDATHAVTKENTDGSVEIKRVRYKAF